MHGPVKLKSSVETKGRHADDRLQGIAPIYIVDAISCVNTDSVSAEISLKKWSALNVDFSRRNMLCVNTVGREMEENPLANKIKSHIKFSNISITDRSLCLAVSMESWAGLAHVDSSTKQLC